MAMKYVWLGRNADAFQLMDEAYALIPETQARRGAGIAHHAGDIEKATDYLFRKNDNRIDDSHSKMMRYNTLANLGAVKEVAYLLKQELDGPLKASTRTWFELDYGFLISNFEVLRPLALSLYDVDEPVDGIEVLNAMTLLEAGEAGKALDILVKARPDLVSGAPEINIEVFYSIGDEGAYYTAMALEDLGRHEEADVIWRAALTAENATVQKNWRKHLNLALIQGRLGSRQEAIKQLQIAYDKGFRFPYSYSCHTCIDNGFFFERGYFEPFFAWPEFHEIVRQIKEDNAATLKMLEARYGMLSEIREEMNETAQQDSSPGGESQ